MSEAHKFCLLLVSDLLFRYTQHAGLKKLKVLKYRGHGICGALSTRVCKAGFQEDTDETIKGKETPVLEGKTPEGERHFFMYCTTPSLTWGDFSDQGLSQLLFLIF